MTSGRILTERIDGSLPGAAPVGTKLHRLSIEVDPRIELLSIVQLLSRYAGVYPVMTRLDFPYRRDVEEAFGPHRGLPVFALLEELSLRKPVPELPPFSFGAPPEAMLYVLPDFSLHPDVFCYDFLVRRAGGRATLERFVKLLRDFAEMSGFAGFYVSNRVYYEEIVRATVAVIGEKDYVGEVEAFTGIRQRSYNLILASLYHSVGYGPNLECGDGSRHAYVILGPKTLEGDVPGYGVPPVFSRIIAHEFGHSIINPLTERHLEFVNRLARPDLIETVKARSGYAEWYDVVNEYIIRAVTTWLAYQDSRERGDAQLAREQDDGFVAVPRLLEKLGEYAGERGRYPDIGAFYTELVGTLDRVRTGPHA